VKFVREKMPYRDCVGTAVFNAKGLVLIGRRKPEDDPEDTSETNAPWQMPQGGIDKGEAPIDTAYRELFEETSIRSVELLAEAPGWIHYDLPDEALGIALKGKYRGQRQRWFAFRFTGADSEINVTSPGGGKHPAEFDRWRWEKLENLPDLIVPFKRDAYLEIVEAFKDIPAKLAG
jgi:putative (di)nucleoside polyphosphate hydrolase